MFDPFSEKRTSKDFEVSMSLSTTSILEACDKSDQPRAKNMGHWLTQNWFKFFLKLFLLVKTYFPSSSYSIAKKNIICGRYDAKLI